MRSISPVCKIQIRFDGKKKKMLCYKNSVLCVLISLVIGRIVNDKMPFFIYKINKTHTALEICPFPMKNGCCGFLYKKTIFLSRTQSFAWPPASVVRKRNRTSKILKNERSALYIIADIISTGIYKDLFGQERVPKAHLPEFSVELFWS